MYIEKLDITKVKHNALLSELPLYEKLNVIKTDETFMGYAMSYKFELVEKKIHQLSQKHVNQQLKICLMIL